MNGIELKGRIGHIKKKLKLLLYCTKSKSRLFFDKLKQIFTLGKIKSNNDLNGKIVAECDFEVEEIGLVEIPDYAGDECHTFVYDVSIYFETKTLNQDKLFKKSCLNWEEMEKYLYSTNGNGYAIHIKNLHIFDKPKELSEYKRKDEFMGGKQVFWETIKKAPQNMMYAYDEKDDYILISIRPEWLCKILNGDKTIEVRKKVLKGYDEMTLRTQNRHF